MSELASGSSLSPTGGEGRGEGAGRDKRAEPSPGSPLTGRTTLSRNAGEGLSGDSVLDVRDLRTYFFLRRGIVEAVDGVSFSLRRGEVLGLVGESGCGKSLTALSVMRLLPKGGARTVAGQVLLNGDDILRRTPREMREIRRSRISMILQDPQTSLNPVFTIGDQLREALLRRLGRRGKTDIMKEAIAALRHVEISAPEQRLGQFPHQMSGGMKQRVVGAIAISGHPDVLIADEPTTALDVTIQLHYLKLLKRLQRETGMAILFITHDFGVVARMCDRVAVMYAGRIVECGPVTQVFDNPSHPYTQALIASVPKMTGGAKRLYTIEGQPPPLMDLPVGCRFAARCAYAERRCEEAYPPSFPAGAEHTADCWRLAAE
jgi:oligopeptide/dipeptide ABC transporter ATP-binding protein